jgi:nitrite reductase/ring-hydroxylating ferredoxin subunit
MPEEVPGPGREYVELTEESALWDGEMESYDVGDAEVLLVKVDGQVHAFDGICPHQSFPLVEGELEGSRLTCRAHEWQFDVRTAESINPRGERLTRHDVRIDADGMIRVRLCTRMTAGSG